MPVDVVWMLGKPGPSADWELRLSMRSFRENYSSEGCSFWIIGHIPSWIDRDKVKCLDWPDPYKHHKDSNLIGKALRLAGEPGLSDPFILCSDDHLLLKPTGPSDFLNWHCGDITTQPSPTSSRWHQGVAYAGKCLREAGYPAKNFEGHVPYLLQKAWCFEALRFPYSTSPGMTIFSTILNAARQVTPNINSGKIRGWIGKDSSMADIDHKLAHNLFATLDNSSPHNPLLKATLDCQFHAPAPWERDIYEVPERALETWETQISVVIPVMNRTDRLVTMLPSWANHPLVKEVLVVDWSSNPMVYEDKKVQELLIQHTKVTILRVDQESYFSLSGARNLGISKAISPTLAVIDVDIVLLDPLWLCRVARQIARQPTRFTRGENGPTYGSVIVSKTLCDLTQGYREDFEGYGQEDGTFFDDLAKMGGASSRFEKNTVFHIPHSDELRTANYRTKNKKQSRAANIERSKSTAPRPHTFKELKSSSVSVKNFVRNV